MTKHLLQIFISFMVCLILPSGSYAMSEPASAVGAETQQLRIVVSSQGTISIYGAKGQTAYVYNVLGVKIASCEIDSNEKHFDLSLTSGCYILKVGNTTRKIFVKR